jgi:predicted AAA+ superfamily ATPase
MYIERNIKKDIEINLFKGKIIIIYGPRRVGKTTLVKEILKQYGSDGKYINCDILQNKQGLESENDKKLREFLGQGKVFVIDEAQRVENIGINLKILVDTYPEIQIIATGSSSFDLSNKINEPLTGRSITYMLYPFSVSELRQMYKDKLSIDSNVENLLLYGGYPEIVSNSASDKIAYLQDLASNYLYKDVLEFEGLKKPEMIVKLLQLIALQMGNEVSYNELATKLETTRKTVMSYIYLLEQAFVIFRLSPYSGNIRNEIGRKNKIYFYDLGIRNALINAFERLDIRDDVGRLWENLLIIERQKLIKEKKWYRSRYFWRTHRGEEIDYIEEYDGVLHGYEFKWGKGKYKIPKVFLDVYKNSDVSIINRSNYLEFLGV